MTMNYTLLACYMYCMFLIACFTTNEHEPALTMKQNVYYLDWKQHSTPKNHDLIRCLLSWHVVYKRIHCILIIFSFNQLSTAICLYYNTVNLWITILIATHTSYIFIWLSSEAVTRSCESGEKQSPLIGKAWPGRKGKYMCL